MVLVFPGITCLNNVTNVKLGFKSVNENKGEANAAKLLFLNGSNPKIIASLWEYVNESKSKLNVSNLGPRKIETKYYEFKVFRE